MIFADLEIGQKFEIEGEDGPIALTKVDEEWREPYTPTNAESIELGGVWVDENQEVKLVNFVSRIQAAIADYKRAQSPL